ncbi:aminoacylase-1-like [Chrysoperla carnea]|uniref:aminoacylase-1-like n=1 Tax=Chrysoperla carnea TaxID=189513 RepID=UPI001D0746B3|nr:aminoacylase-1-like [Chrysoperla carnea]
MSKVNQHPLASHPAIQNFRKYLQIKSVQPNPDYGACVDFITGQAKELGLPIKVHEFVKGKPIVVISWEGTNPNLPSILLNGHMDVVPVVESKWKYDPFAAEIDEKGNIYARGAQDMKSVSIQYLEAIRYLKQNGVKLRRTIHISFVPDEEIFSADGMALFVKTKEFKELNIGFGLDECGPSSNKDYVAINSERLTWTLEIVCTGNAGHGLMLIPNTAAEKVQYLLNKFLKYREEQSKKMKHPLYDLGNVTTVNLTKIQGGIQSNVIPSKITMIFDCRVTPSDAPTFDSQVKQWCEEAGGDSVTYKYLCRKDPIVPTTKTDDSNPFWKAFESVFKKRNDNLVVITCPGATDARFLREVGIPALGISPMPETPFLLHDHNEFVNAKTFLDGIELYKEIISAIANVE